MSILPSPPSFVRAGSELESWRVELRDAVRDPHDLCEKLGLPPALADAAADGAGQFPVFVPPSYLARIRRGDSDDPLLRQVLPLVEEGADIPGFTHDPVDDRRATLQSGVLQKYAGRALLITTGACAIHCRYCFRRHFPYQQVPHNDVAWDAALAAIAEDPTISEVILSGGDPLTLVDERLATLVHKISAIRHVETLRIHTRLPIMIPGRVNAALLELLDTERFAATVVVLHANHAQELNDDVASAASSLRASRVVLLNQAVLLRTINDTVAAQRELSQRLVELGVVPYYLHQLDRVAGAAHFEVPVERGRRIVESLARQVPGYLVPRYVREIPGQPHKISLL